MTNLSEVYDMFLSKISDYNIANLLETELNEELLMYFKSARTEFHKCKNSLDLDESETIIVGDLTPYEIKIIVKLMIVEYMTPIMLSSEIVKQSLSDKDFKIHSQANHLRELTLLYRLLQKEAEKMITKYSYMGMTDL
jgi:hypothetical protein